MTDLIKHLQDGGKVAFRAAPGVALDVWVDGDCISHRLARWYSNGQFFFDGEKPFDLVPHQPADDDWGPWVERPEGEDSSSFLKPTEGVHCIIHRRYDGTVTRYRLRKPAAQTAEQRLEAAKAAYAANPCEANHHAVMRAQEALTSPTGGVK